MLHKVRKLDNKGFSLVEIIVSLVLLSIVFIPITSGFIQSMKVSEEAKVMQQASTIGQTIMEEFKVLSLEKLFLKYGETTTLEQFKASGNAELGEMRTDSATGEIFQTKITLSANATDEVKEINQVEFPVIYDMASSRNMIATGTEIPSWLVDDFELSHNTYSKSTILSKFHRTYKINIKKLDTSEFPLVEITVKYTNALDSSYEFEDTIARKSMSAPLESIYFYIESNGTPNSEDLEVVNNTDGRDVINLFLHAKIDKSKESSYKIKTINSVSNGGLEDYNYNVVSNIGIKGSSRNFGWNDDADKYITQTKAKTRRYDVKISVYKKNKKSGSLSKAYCELESTRGGED